MIRIIIFFVFFLTYSFANSNNSNISDSFIQKQNEIINKKELIKKKYEYLLNNKYSKKELLKKLGIQNGNSNLTEKQFLDNALKKINEMKANLFKNYKYFTPNEINIMKKRMREMIDFIRSKKYNSLYFFYFASESVPKTSIANFLLDINILRKNGFNVHSRIFFIGPPNDFRNYMISWEDFLEKDYPYPKAVVNNFALKINPYFFEAYQIKKVPVIAFAICKNSDYISFNDCSIKYLVRGDTSLEYFLFLISQANPKFNKMYRSLLTNNFKLKKHNK